MRARRVHITGVGYRGKEINEVVEELAEESGYTIPGIHITEYESADNREGLRTIIRQLRRYPQADVLFATGITRRQLQLKPHIKTVSTLERGLLVLENGYDGSWRKWEVGELARVIKSDEKRARQLRSGQASFTNLEKKRLKRISGA